MDFTESPEHTELRAAVAGLAARFGHAYFVDRARSGRKTEELWQAMAEHGFLTVNLPERFGGGGAGISELAIACQSSSVLAPDRARSTK